MSFEDGDPGRDPQRADDADVQARTQSDLDLIRLPIAKTIDESLLKQQWSGALRDLQKNKKWDGFVFEMELLEP